MRSLPIIRKRTRMCEVHARRVQDKNDIIYSFRPIWSGRKSTEKLMRIWRALHVNVNFVHDREKPYRSLSTVSMPHLCPALSVGVGEENNNRPHLAAKHGMSHGQRRIFCRCGHAWLANSEVDRGATTPLAAPATPTKSKFPRSGRLRAGCHSRVVAAFVLSQPCRGRGGRRRAKANLGDIADDGSLDGGGGSLLLFKPSPVSDQR